MRLTERKTVYSRCDKQGNLTKIDCIEIKNKGLAEVKLCSLEDIEDELGIDLIILFKALKDMIYIKDDNEIKKAYPTLNHIKNEGYVFDVLCSRIVKLSDYGKTWALTKEVLK